MVYHVLVLLGGVGEGVETFGGEDSSALQLCKRHPLQVLVFVSEEVLPLEEGMAHVSLLVLLAIGDKVEPVVDNFAELDKSAPSVEHPWLQVIVCAVPVLPPTDRFGEQVETPVGRVVSKLLSLHSRETFVFHERLQVGDVHLLVKYLLNDGSDFVHFDHCLCELCLGLPSIESIADLSRDEVAEHNLLFLRDNLVSVDLPAQVRVVLQQLASVDLCQASREVSRCHILVVLTDVALAADKVLNHLEGTLQAFVVVLPSHVGEV